MHNIERSPEEGKSRFADPINLVSNNARYQRCRLTQKAALRMDIQLVHLPPCSPDHNLIERFWKLLKKRALTAYYYATEKDLRDAVGWFIKEVNNGEYCNELCALPMPDFQSLLLDPNFSQLVAA